MKSSWPEPRLPRRSASTTSKEWNSIREWEESGSAAWRLRQRGLSAGTALPVPPRCRPRCRPQPRYQFWLSIQAAKHWRTAMGSAEPAYSWCTCSR